MTRPRPWRAAEREDLMASIGPRMNAVSWFEIPVRDPGRAAAFYEKVFTVQLDAQTVGGMKIWMFPSFRNAAGAAGALIKGRTYEPSHAGTVVYFSVEDIDAALERVNANGGRTLMPKTSIGEHGSIAQFEDTEGNRLALHSTS